MSGDDETRKVTLERWSDKLYEVAYGLRHVYHDGFADDIVSVASEMDDELRELEEDEDA